MTQYQRLVVAPAPCFAGGSISLTTEQQHYLVRVLRLRAGDRFIAMDGQGQWWLSVLTADLTQAEILEAIAVATELPVSVDLLLSMPKTGIDDVVRQATELGVSRILPVISDRTILKPSPQKLDRWRRIAQEAAEQSERQVVPEIHSPQKWSDALQEEYIQRSLSYLCEARGNYPHLLAHLEREGCAALSALNPPMLTVAIGPEGGWTDAEITEAIAVGFQPVSLGFRILRAVTAPLVALSLVASVFEVMPQTQKAD